jgi:hypothetical protein
VSEDVGDALSANFLWHPGQTGPSWSLLTGVLYFQEAALQGATVSVVRKNILETMPVLLLLGILAGSLGGLGVGLITIRATSPSSSTAGK